jgi:hypothetical protein
MTVYIEILKHAAKGFQVRVIGAEGRTLAMLAYPTIEIARGAARALTVAHGDCPVVDKSGVKE